MSYSTLDLRDLAEERDELRQRDLDAKTCAHCERPITRAAPDQAWVETPAEPPPAPPAKAKKAAKPKTPKTEKAKKAAAEKAARELVERCTCPDNLTGHEPNGAPLDDEEAERLAALQTIDTWLDRAEDEPTAIDEDGFEEYAEDLADDLGAYSRKASNSWPLCHIDWTAAAEALKVDYETFEFEDTTYLVRSC